MAGTGDLVRVERGGGGLVYQIVIIKTFSKYSITIPKCNNKV